MSGEAKLQNISADLRSEFSRVSCVQLSYWRQFEQGMLSQDAVRILMELCEIAADNKGR